jgi:GT2 family glycosyltransferase
MSAPKKILLVFPVFQALVPRAFENFAQILIAAGRQTDYLFGPWVIERTSLVAAMNLVGERMTQEDWEAVIVFDDDCFPPCDVIPRLLRRCFDEGHRFVAAAGVMRGYPFTTTAATYYPEGITGEIGPSGRVERLSGFRWLDDLPEAFTEVDFCGVPAAIIHRDCFRRVAPPWFADLDEQGVRITHDVFFCKKLREAGIPVYVDGTIRCGHLAEAPIITFENRLSARAPVSTP